MGWRPGQGIGPRLTWRQRKIQELQASVGYLVAQDDLKLDESNVDEEAKKHTYPRRDTPMLLVPRKENPHGIGYIPGMSLDDSLGGSNNASSSGPQISGTCGGNHILLVQLTLHSWVRSWCFERSRRG